MFSSYCFFSPIQGTACKDCCQLCFCNGCLACQMHREAVELGLIERKGCADACCNCCVIYVWVFTFFSDNPKSKCMCTTSSGFLTDWGTRCIIVPYTHLQVWYARFRQRSGLNYGSGILDGWTLNFTDWLTVFAFYHVRTHALTCWVAISRLSTLQCLRRPSMFSFC